MKQILKRRGSLILSTVILVFIIGMGCSDDLKDKTFYTSDVMTITQTLESDRENFSIYIELLHKAGYYTSLQSYGSYTCLVPTNSVLEPYIKNRWGVSAVNELNTAQQIEEVRELVKFHTVAKGRTVSSYGEGRMPDTTYTGDFLTTSFLEKGGISNIVINKEAKLLKYDIRNDNGIIHVIDKVLTPYSDPVPKVMEKAGKHTIFVEALKKTGLYDVFSVLRNESGGKMYYTIFAESDSVFALLGINSFDDLAAKYADTDDYENELNGLNRFMAYHATQAFYYTADLPAEAFVSTVLKKNAIKVQKVGLPSVLKINETETGEKETWISLYMPWSNSPAKNGVYHTVNTIMDVFVPSAKYIIFDPVNDQPEYQSKLVTSHQKEMSSFYQNVNWYPPTNTVRFLQMSSNSNLNYSVFDLGGCIWYEFVTPILPKGKYELIICANGGNSARGQFQVYWDGNPIGSIYDLTTKGVNIGYPDSVAMEANGWRAGYKWITNNAGDTQYANSNCLRRVVTKELLCPEQSTHTIRLLTVKSGGCPLDYFEFIPVK